MSCLRLIRFTSANCYSQQNRTVLVLFNKRCMAATARKAESAAEKALQQSSNSGQLTTGQKVVAGTKTVTYFGSTIVAGVVLVGIGYALFKELWADEGPINLMTIAAEKYKFYPNVQQIVGTPIKIFGKIHYNKMARRHPDFTTYTGTDGRRYVQITFIMNGPNAASQCFVEFREKDVKSYWNSNWEIIYATLKNKTNGRLYLLEDNRKAPADLVPEVPTLPGLGEEPEMITTNIKPLL